MDRRSVLSAAVGGAALAALPVTSTPFATAQGIGLSRAFVYHPKKVPGTPWPGLPPFETLRYTGKDGQPLAAWFWRGTRPAGTPLTVFFHGNAGNFEDSTRFTAGLIAAGYPVLLPEYRGYGGLPGKPTEAGLRADAQAALVMAQQLGWAAENTFITGHSLGGALAFHALHDQGQTARGAIIMSTFTSLPDMAGLARGLMADQFNNLALASQTRVPVAWVHGTKDRLIPIRHGQTLFSALPPTTTKTFIIIDTPHAAQHRTYQAAMVKAIEWHLSLPG
ncbi:MAG: alpha/beta hydrolase [Alphaproteobacteria bacterium]